MISYRSGNMGLWAFFILAVLALIPGESNQQATQGSTSNLTCSQDDRNMLELVINLQKQIHMMTYQTNQILATLNSLVTLMRTETPRPRDCSELLALGERSSGQYVVYDGDEAFTVYCDMETDGGGWTVFQRRQDGLINFKRDWANYRQGFGNVSTEFWLGLERLHHLTQAKTSHLRVDISDWEGNTAYAEYSNFIVAGEDDQYRLSLSGFSGTAGDSMTCHSGQRFSTRDRDNDASSVWHCAQRRRGAWWYRYCGYSNLNGVYHGSGPGASSDNIIWYYWKGDYYALKMAEMKLRPA